MKNKEKYKRDDFGNRMKSYENVGNNLKLIPNLPIVVRLDGNRFSKLSKILDLKKPYDDLFSDVMQKTAGLLINNQSKCVVAYTQSDEITLIFKDTYDSPIEFDRRVQKLCSILASKCTIYFNTLLKLAYPDNEKLGTAIFPVFDARIFNVPDWVEASNSLVWRESDATKNSIQSAGQSELDHKQIQGLSNNQVQELLLEEADINWNDYPEHFKKGTYLIRYKNDLDKTEIVQLEGLPPLSQINLEDRLELLFKNM